MPENNTIAAITSIVGQINPLVALAINAISAARAIRDAAKAAGVEVKYLCEDHPEQTGSEGGTCPTCGKTLVSSLPSDPELIAKFANASGALKADAAAAKAWAESL